jgi:ribosomal protein L31
MEKNIHPELQDVTVDCTCGNETCANEFHTGSTVEKIKVISVPTLELTQLFHIMIETLSATGEFNTVTYRDEGRKAVTIQHKVRSLYSVKLILCPEAGIIFEGENEKMIKSMRVLMEKIIRQRLDQIFDGLD